MGMLVITTYQLKLSALVVGPIARRKFIEAANGITGQTSISRQFVTLINQLFRIEKRVQGASNQERLAIRQEQSRGNRESDFYAG
jgi:hypothetical protein